MQSNPPSCTSSLVEAACPTGHLMAHPPIPVQPSIESRPSDALDMYLSKCTRLDGEELEREARSCITSMYLFPQYGFDVYDMSKIILSERVVENAGSYDEACHLWETHIAATKPEDLAFRALVQEFISELDTTECFKYLTSRLRKAIHNVRDLCFAALCVWSDFRHRCGDLGFFAFARNAISLTVPNCDALNSYLAILLPRVTLRLLPDTTYNADAIIVSHQLYLNGAEDHSSTIALHGSFEVLGSMEVRNVTFTQDIKQTNIFSVYGNCSKTPIRLVNATFRSVNVFVEYAGNVLMDRTKFELSDQALNVHHIDHLVMQDCHIDRCKSGIIGTHVDKIELHRLRAEKILERNLFSLSTKDISFNGLVYNEIAHMGSICLPLASSSNFGIPSDISAFVINTHEEFVSGVPGEEFEDRFDTDQPGVPSAALDPSPKLNIPVCPSGLPLPACDLTYKLNQARGEDGEHNAELDNYALFQSDGHITAPVPPNTADLPELPRKPRLPVFSSFCDSETPGLDHHKKAKKSPSPITRD